MCFPMRFERSDECCSSQWNSMLFEIAAVDSRGRVLFRAREGPRPWTAVDGRGQPWSVDGRGRGQPWTAVEGRGGGDAVVTAE